MPSLLEGLQVNTSLVQFNLILNFVLVMRPFRTADLGEAGGAWMTEMQALGVPQSFNPTIRCTFRNCPPLGFLGSCAG
jgi:hypothetical protein